ncbi:transcription factor TFIIIB component B'' homolog Bdp1 [Andrena cerasifolii]|uniref:transcription factor TFIIIB component B'' homolog Bdp1 n=1 Tax=Andrena cerasifolii TaxID=2819439 RepID=UPI004037FA4B
MKRARIKAMVTVPTRRKTTQDLPIIEVDVTESNGENKTPSDDVCATSHQFSESNIEEKQAQETSVIEIQIQNEQSFLNDENIHSKDNSKQSFNESIKEVVQTAENSNITQIASPTKSAQCRVGFIKPTPKLDSGGRARRNSIQGSGASASESEDDSRRVISSTINSVKNDSVHSVQNAKDTVVNNNKNNVSKSKVGQKRRILVSESARKLAEARREFHLKHENKTPDRSKLTMYDLIYYNPVTNPMKRSKESEMTARKISECQSEEFHEEENEDDPSSAMPVPQVKVGPDGQLIIDEQSLVIEQTNAKKGREVLAKEAIIDDDSNGSGFYKKRQKSKEWPKWETLKFYKALNTVGTDFLLMQSLFPNRTRQEIKLKFKKEEKVNRNLVEKALAYHQEFDTEILEKSLATFEHSEKEYVNAQKKHKQLGSKEKNNVKPERKRKGRIVASSIGEMDASDNEEEQCLELTAENENTETSDRYQQLLKKANKKRKRSTEEKKISGEPLTEMDDIESLGSCNGFDSDTEIYHVRPTRSGRLPKVKKLQGPDINTLDNERLNYESTDYETVISTNANTKAENNSNLESTNSNIETRYEKSVKTVIPNIGHVEPGSLVILSKESSEEPGKSVLQVYMVSSDINSSQNLEESTMTPVNLPPELLATVTTRLSDVESITVKEECE